MELGAPSRGSLGAGETSAGAGRRGRGRRDTHRGELGARAGLDAPGLGRPVAPCGRAGPVRLPAQRAPAAGRLEDLGRALPPLPDRTAATWSQLCSKFCRGWSGGCGRAWVLCLPRFSGCTGRQGLVPVPSDPRRVEWRPRGSGIAEAEGWRGRRDVEGMVIAESASGAAVPGAARCSRQRQAVCPPEHGCGLPVRLLSVSALE